MGRDGILHHVQDGDFLKGGGAAGNVRKAGTEFFQKRITVLPGMQHGRMGLRKGLGCGINRNVHTNGVGEVIGHKGGGDRFFAMLRMTKRNGYLNDLGDGFAGGNGYGDLGTAAVKLKDNLAGNGGFGHGRNGYSGIPDVSFIEETGLLDGHLHGDCHHHFAFGDGVTHGRVVSIHTHIIGGEFVGGAEAEGELAVLVGEKMRLEREGLEEFASDCYILGDSCICINGIGRNRHLFFGHLHCHGCGSGIHKDGVLAHAGHCLGAVAHHHNVVV